MSQRLNPKLVDVTLDVNGELHELSVEPRRLLLDLLRDDLGLTGAKRGCEEGVCGGCTVLLDGRNVKSCLLLAAQVSGKSVTTVEGLADADGTLHTVQEAFIRHGALQCGYCTPGMIMNAVALLREKPKPSADEIRSAMDRNMCRCGTHLRIMRAVEKAAEKGGA